MLPSEYIRIGWIQGCMAIDEDWAELEYGDEPEAVAWCLTGACNAACLAPQPDPPQLGEMRISRIADVVEAILEEREQLPPASVVPDGHSRSAERWNDMPERTQAEVIELLEEAERRLGLR